MYGMLVKISGDQIFMNFVGFLIHDNLWSFTMHGVYGIVFAVPGFWILEYQLVIGKVFPSR